MVEAVADIIAPTVTFNRRRRSRIVYLEERELLRKENVFPKIELLGPERIAMLSPLHVLIDLGNRHIEVEIQAQDRPREKNDEHREGSVLEIGHLNLHGSEFYSPTD
jgi:hypothetical protein